MSILPIFYQNVTFLRNSVSNISFDMNFIPIFAQFLQILYQYLSITLLLANEAPNCCIPDGCAACANGTEPCHPQSIFG
jgi:hypothetical protein